MSLLFACNKKSGYVLANVLLMKPAKYTIRFSRQGHNQYKLQYISLEEVTIVSFQK